MAKGRGKGKREFDPLKPQWPSRKEIICKDCKYRDKSFIVVGGIKVYVGITRDSCERYKGTTYKNRKPHDVLFLNDMCQYYQEDV